MARYLLILTFAGVAMCSGGKSENVDRFTNTKSSSIAGGVKGKLREPSLQAYGLPKSWLDLNFGDNPVIERELIDSKVKTTHRRFAHLPEVQVQTSTREPGIQAYGLPKKFLRSSGEIERISVTSSESGSAADKNNPNGDQSGIQAYGVVRSSASSENGGSVEMISRNTDENKVAHLRPKVRGSRSIDGSIKNDLYDLERQEAKVFRPLFVYRQQIADRYRSKPRENPIYGAYQYGPNINRKKSTGYNRSRKYYY